MNEIWRMDSDYLLAYTEDKAVWRKIRRSYPQFAVFAEYYRSNRLIAITYKVPSAKKKTIKRMLGVNVTVDRTSA